MKKRFLVIFAALLLAHTVFAENLRTANGEIYRNIKLKEVTHRGLVFMHSEGVVTVKPSELGDRDKIRFKEELETYKKRVADEKKRVIAERKRVAAEKKQASLEARKKQQQLNKRFDADIARVKRMPLQRHYEEGRKLQRKYRRERVNRRPLNALIAAGKKQKMSAPVLSKAADLKLSRLYALTLVAACHKFALAADPKSQDAAKIKAQETRCETTAFGIFRSLTLDEKIVILWKISSDITKIQEIAAAVPADNKEQKALANRIRSAANSVSAKMAAAVRSYGFNAGELKRMNFDNNAKIKTLFATGPVKLFCTGCKARGTLNDKGVISLGLESRKVSVEACKECGGLGVKAKF